MNNLEDYLFSKRRLQQYEYFLEEYLSEEKINQMEKEKIIHYINMMRPKSLWEKHFYNIGNEKLWENDIKNVHEVRNKVSHHKFITEEEYANTVRKINNLNKMINSATKQVEDNEFTVITSYDALESFAVLVNKMREFYNQYDFSALSQSISQAMQNLIKPLSELYANGITDAVQSISKSMLPLIDMTRVQGNLLNIKNTYYGDTSNNTIRKYISIEEQEKVEDSKQLLKEELEGEDIINEE